MVSTDIMVTMTPVMMMFRAQRAIHKVLCLGFACKIYAIKFINTNLYINIFTFYLVFQFLTFFKLKYYAAKILTLMCTAYQTVNFNEFSAAKFLSLLYLKLVIHSSGRQPLPHSYISCKASKPLMTSQTLQCSPQYLK